MGIPQDRVETRLHCQRRVTHRVVDYKDCQYMTCSFCGARTKWCPSSEDPRVMLLCELKVKDRTADLDKFKRRAKRRYRRGGEIPDD